MIEARRRGDSYRTIARAHRVSFGFVAAAVKRYVETKSHSDRPRSGRPRKATPAVAMRAASLLRDRKVGSVRKARQELRAEGIDLSRGTVHNIAVREGLRSAVPIPKPKLMQAHREARLAWATEHQKDDEARIRQFVFVDEKQFRVTDASHRVWLGPLEQTPIRETSNHTAA